MKIAFLGMGSIGLRHENNLKILRPQALSAVYDPGRGIGTYYPTDHEFIREHADADGVIIASPNDCHRAQIDAVLLRGIPVYIEKPLTSIAQWTPTTREALLHFAPASKAAVGYQYRFNVTQDQIAQWVVKGRMRFEARDNLIERYGPTAIETMGSHALDLALAVLGPARHVALFTDGRYFSGRVEHARGVSEYDMRIDVGPRTSTINGQPNNIGNEVYLAALGAWLHWIETGERDTRLATLTDGAAVMDVMASCRTIQPMEAQP